MAPADAAQEPDEDSWLTPKHVGAQGVTVYCINIFQQTSCLCGEISLQPMEFPVRGNQSPDLNITGKMYWDAPAP
ncbi:hypothetical protein NDU88_004436 [Pleurodeles waltl]|uniref:Uncharacterized protein n=1 Tax=Pleurodeles waltl TaxID=8319 RepID=A0AAV7MV51_PLEWA|nr:hypothetical protein NDU88_004436 [Pleurodeles waltl]